MTPAEQQTITANERLQLIGLLALAAKHDNAMTDIDEAACAITGDKPNDGSHTSDAVYNDGRRDVDALLERLEITVEGVDAKVSEKELGVS